jgi:hypothetical protein
MITRRPVSRKLTDLPRVQIQDTGIRTVGAFTKLVSRR